MALKMLIGIAAPNRTGRVVRIEAAMKAALDKALSEGVSNPVQLKRRILEARDNAKRTAEG